MPDAAEFLLYIGGRLGGSVKACSSAFLGVNSMIICL